ncbi:hypothetical protein QYM36_003632 [Artemia franciscana]|uniref:Coatomer subunit epsilon n=1 Tax=Artemia franciscana TaxID=6661 RepID=A0AA88LH26_ARTSF|nr:hypothetical protein QYM36_003632 [Artemia franciscana]
MSSRKTRVYYLTDGAMNVIKADIVFTKSSEPAVNIERDWYLYRSYLAQRKYGLVNDEVKSSSSAILQPLKLLAQYLGSPSSRTTVVEALNSQMNAPIDPDNYGVIIVGATIFIWQQNYEAALRLLHGSKLLECHALMLQVYIKMDRMDMATKVLKKMQEIDDDSVLTNLSQAWLHLAMGGEKLQDAFYVFQELVDKEVITPLILNGLAAVHICQERYPEAESALQEAEHVDSSHAETFLNLSVLSQLTGKSAQESQRYQRLLRDAHPEHWFLSDLDAKEREFDRLSRMFSPSDQS